MPEEEHNAVKSTSEVKVWAEEREVGEVLLTWQWTSDPPPERDAAADKRSVAASLGVIDGVSSSEAADGGVRVRFDTETVTKPRLAAALRVALALEGDLKTRANELIKRAPAYASLAKSLALDERVSPVPDAARAAAARRGSPMAATPLRFVPIPGFRLASQLYTILPMLRTLATWSREAPPEVVDEHLQRAGLSREQLDRDLATAHEGMLFAREYTAGTASALAGRATTAATQARASARDWVEKRNQPPAPKRYEP